METQELKAHYQEYESPFWWDPKPPRFGGWVCKPEGGLLYGVWLCPHAHKTKGAAIKCAEKAIRKGAAHE